VNRRGDEAARELREGGSHRGARSIRCSRLVGSEFEERVIESGTAAPHSEVGLVRECWLFVVVELPRSGAFCEKVLISYENNQKRINLSSFSFRTMLISQIDRI
jgi:hypothetical protein